MIDEKSLKKEKKYKSINTNKKTLFMKHYLYIKRMSDEER